MSQHLRQGDILFDVGAEKGTESVKYARFVGAQNMVLFEGEPLVWPNIRNSFEESGLFAPLACYVGLVSDVTHTPEDLDYPEDEMHGWPIITMNEPTDHRTFRYIHDHSNNTKQTTIDDWVEVNHIIPNAITMDIEGAEYVALLGAHDVLGDHRPLVWVSIHPDLMERDYQTTPSQLMDYMESFGYRGEFLGFDHEHHWLFR